MSADDHACACGHASSRHYPNAPHLCAGPPVEVTADPATFLAAMCPACPCKGFKCAEGCE